MKPPHLVSYGIQTEESDIRAHVSPLARCIYVYRTTLMRDLLSQKEYPEAGARQSGVVGITGWGRKVPIAEVPDLRIIHSRMYPWHTFPPITANTSEKGAAAVAVVCAAIGAGRFPLWLRASESKDTAIQLDGTDIVLCCRQRIQVKCDWKAARREQGGYGNLFIQTAERNPLGRT